MPLRKYNKLYTDRPLVTRVFDAGDSVEWTDQDSIHRLGIIAYVALPDTQIPKHYIGPGIHFKSMHTSFGRYIVDCGLTTYMPGGTQEPITCTEYRAASFGNETLRRVPFEVVWNQYA